MIIILTVKKYLKKWQIFQYTPIGKFGSINRKNFEITDKEFLKFQSDVLKVYEYKNKIQFKSSQSRNKFYMLIDNSGNAWISFFKPDVSEDRILIGNILNLKEWKKISSYLEKNV